MKKIMAVLMCLAVVALVGGAAFAGEEDDIVKRHEKWMEKTMLNVRLQDQDRYIGPEKGYDPAHDTLIPPRGGYDPDTPFVTIRDWLVPIGGSGDNWTNPALKQKGYIVSYQDGENIIEKYYDLNWNLVNTVTIPPKEPYNPDLPYVGPAREPSKEPYNPDLPYVGPAREPYNPEYLINLPEEILPDPNGPQDLAYEEGGPHPLPPTPEMLAELENMDEILPDPATLQAPSTSVGTELFERMAVEARIQESQANLPAGVKMVAPQAPED